MNTNFQLSEEHLNELTRSGLNQETIIKSKIESIALNDLYTYLGYSIEGASSAYRIPYLTVPNYCRFKMFYKSGMEQFTNGEKKPKYLQARNSEARPYVLPEIMSISSKTSKPIFITEGEKKTLKLIQSGEYAIGLSGVWNFKAGKDSSSKEEDKYLWKELRDINWHGRLVYLAFDSDFQSNTNVLSALYELSLKLIGFAAIVKFITWNAKDGKGLDDYLVSQEAGGKQSTDVISALKDKSISLDKFIELNHLDYVIRALSLIDFNGIKKDQIVGIIAKQCKVSKLRINQTLSEKKASHEKELIINESDKKGAIELLKTPVVFVEFLKTCHSEYLGRDSELILVKLATISRHFDKGLSVVISGTSSIGKSDLISTILRAVFENDKEDFTRISENYLLYRKEPIEHKVITFFEMRGTQSSAHIIRTALSEGKLAVGSVINDKLDGLKTIKIDKPAYGVVVLSTYASGKLDRELNTRVIHFELNHDQLLARRILLLKANEKVIPGVVPFEKWRIADGLILKKPVTIPYIDKIAELFPTKDERFLRDFDKVKLLIKSSVLFHQFQREKNSTGQLIATMDDYCLVFHLRDLISQTVSQVSKKLIQFLEKIQDISNDSGGEPPTREEIQKHFDASLSTIKRYISKAVKESWIEIQGVGKNQTLKVIEIPKSISPLPLPEEIFNITESELLSQSRYYAEFIGINQLKANLIQPESIEPTIDLNNLSAQLAQVGSNGGEPTQSLVGSELEENSSTAQ